jgi:hypothetical protein
VDGTPSNGKEEPQNIPYPWDLNDNAQDKPTSNSAKSNPGQSTSDAPLKEIRPVLNLEKDSS